MGFSVLWGLGKMDKDTINKNPQPKKEQKPSDETQAQFRQISKDELKQIYNDHITWIKSKRKEGKRADLRLLNLKGLKLKNAILAYADLQQSNLFRVNLQQAILIRTNLKKSNLCQANLRMASLYKANLESAEIIGSILSNSNLTEANLRNCSCRGSDFEGAIFLKANLQGADLLSTFFEDADFRDANLKGVKNLTIDQLQGTKTLYKAKLEPELMEQVKTSNPNLLKEPQK